VCWRCGGKYLAQLYFRKSHGRSDHRCARSPPSNFATDESSTFVPFPPQNYHDGALPGIRLVGADSQNGQHLDHLTTTPSPFLSTLKPSAFPTVNGERAAAGATATKPLQHKLGAGAVRYLAFRRSNSAGNRPADIPSLQIRLQHRPRLVRLHGTVSMAALGHFRGPAPSCTASRHEAPHLEAPHLCA